jgi:alkylated DNA repair dioxygenase AlkB
MDKYIDALVADWEPEALSSDEASKGGGDTGRQWRTLIDDHGMVRVCDDYLSAEEASALFEHCKNLQQWAFDKPLGNGWKQRRGICMQAAPGVVGYKYSGQMITAAPLDDMLGPLLDRVNRENETDFNSWLLNQYRPRGLNGSEGDYIGPHSDDEKALAVASDGRSVVFGLTLTNHSKCLRPMVFTRKTSMYICHQLVTRAGQAYTMEGEFQKHWTHELPKRLGVPGTRISLTARKFVA